jgi:hypothetical protein
MAGCRRPVPDVGCFGEAGTRMWEVAGFLISMQPATDQGQRPRSAKAGFGSFCILVA